LPTATGSKLFLVSIESTSATDPRKAVEEIQAAGINHLDIVIANAGACPSMVPLDTVDIKDVIDAFNVNTVGPIRLFQAVKPLLEKSSSPKWVSVSSAVGSITNQEVHKASFLGAYGVSKAALNWFTV
jgi:NAD(P)-dependent dehydrogenase (short-subunit alcohol dehydrogenase family)